MALSVAKREKQTVENTPCEWKTYKDGISFQIYGLGHPLYQFASARIQRIMESQDIFDLDADSLTGEDQLAAVGKYLVKDWKGINDEETGKKLEVTPDNFIAVIEKEPEVWKFIEEKSLEIQLDFNKKVEATKKK